jgi:hypothetical protein
VQALEKRPGKANKAAGPFYFAVRTCRASVRAKPAEADLVVVGVATYLRWASMGKSICSLSFVELRITGSMIVRESGRPGIRAEKNSYAD